MAINWGLAQSVDVGGAIQQGFERGQARRRETQARDALTAYAMNPDDPASFEALARTNPQFAIQQRQTMVKTKEDAASKRAELINGVAIWADTPEKWDAGVKHLVEAGYPDLAQYAGKFSPEARMSAIAATGQMLDYIKQQQPVNMAPGNRLVNPQTGGIIASAPFAPKTANVKEGETVVEYQPGGQAPAAGFDSFYQGFLAPAEGGYVASDGRSGAPANFGVNQKANPDIDVANLTQEQAAQIMHDRYWVPSGADRIEDPALQAVHADTAVNMGVGAAKGMLEQSGGDPQQYLALREQRYREIGGPDLPGWLKRNKSLATYIGSGGRVIAQGPDKQPKPPKPKWRSLTPQEAQQRGLPKGVWQESPDGEIKPVSGATGKNAPQSAETYSQSAMDAFNRAIASAGRLMNHEGMKAAVGSAFDPASFGTVNPFSGKTLGGTEAANFGAELDAMKAQVFLPMVQSMKGMGALSNAEGEKLTAAIGALDPNMSESGFKASLRRIVTDLVTYRDRSQQGAPTGKTMPKPTAKPGFKFLGFEE